MVRLVALILTVMTGFSGLVYEVAWQKYLATLLGSHSEATAAVLAIFLGGLSVGYWVFGRVTRTMVERAQSAGRPPRLLMLYGALEGSIGLYVLAFPWIFMGVQSLSYSLPLGAGGIGFVVDVVLSTLLIGPASVLMGGTIPILTQALSRSLEDATRFHAFVYAFNTGGAFVGALAAGFYLIPKLGLVQVMLAMGTINLFAGAIFIALGMRGRAVVSLDAPLEEGGVHPKLEGFAVYALVAALSGFAMMTIQTTAIRVAGLSFGSSQFTFSMVVAVFVLCIALGSFGVSALSRIPTSVVVANQWLLAALFLLIYPRVEEVPHRVYLLRTVFRDIDAAFGAYHFAGFLALLVVLGIPVILSGAALPLLFHHLRREVENLGDLAGRLYSWNTVGSLLGALIGGYLLFFWLDLHEVYRVAVVALLWAALILTVKAYSLRPTWLALAIPLLIVVVLLPEWNPRFLYAGHFRLREPRFYSYDGIDSILENHPNWFIDNIIYSEDDPIASVAVREWDEDGVRAVSISVNGKIDGNTHLDRPTMGLIATLSAMLADDPKSAFVIGWGTGVTVGELAEIDSIERVDVAEISPGVMNAATYFDFANFNSTTHPKVRVIEGDAYRALIRNEGTYDVVASVPSNPWVAGTEMLFSREFLEVAKSKLSPGGVYCQWFHQYEIGSDAVVLALRTYAEVFDHIAVWRANGTDLLILGFNRSGPASDHFRLEARSMQPDYKAALERSGVGSFAALLAHEVLPLGVVHAMGMEGPLHTLYHPILSDLAGRGFFRNDRGSLPFTGWGEPARVGHKNSMARAYFDRVNERDLASARIAYIEESCRVYGKICLNLLNEWIRQTGTGPGSDQLIARRDQLVRTMRAHDDALPPDTSRLYGSYPEEHRLLHRNEAFELTDLFSRTYSHAFPYSADSIDEVWGSCREEPTSEAECIRMITTQSGAPEDGGELEKRVKQCVNRRRVGRRCQDGAVQARALVERGAPSELLDRWRDRQEPGQGT